jgi:hypothetical protein
MADTEHFTNILRKMQMLTAQTVDWVLGSVFFFPNQNKHTCTFFSQKQLCNLRPEKLSPLLHVIFTETAEPEYRILCTEMENMKNIILFKLTIILLTWRIW